VGWYTAVGVEVGTGVVHAAYYDYTKGELRYASRKSGSWVVLVDGLTGQAGWDLSMALRSGMNSGTNDVHLTYYDTVNGDLKHATLTNCL
jgi:hypothetical protein